ncbi:gamma-glutamyltransferase family protein [Terrarubrum flagellatum]|uniref:gamma-glutamyltransferase family protein n=1 Tax=Terrirubrum flagellatum TaxID=2895980 RepID=UPI0031455BA3
MVAAGHPLAAIAALRILEGKGNAVDAGVAAGFALNVLQPDMANLGGVAPILIRMADGRTTTIAGVGRWPKLATLQAVAAAGGGRIPEGPQRWVTPAAVDSWLLALRRYGTMSAADILSPAIELARDGFAMHYFLQSNLAENAERLRGWPGAAETYLPGGSVPATGDILRQPRLAATLEHLAAAERKARGKREAGVIAARDAFYKGEIAAEIGRFAESVGSFLRVEDLHDFAVEELPAVSVTYRGQTVFACGPWSQGPAVLQMLRIAERFDLKRMTVADRTHVLVEAAKASLADRNRFYGDPDVVNPPLERLISAGHGAEHARRIELTRAANLTDQSSPVGLGGPDTTYACVVDRMGNAFSATPSDSTMLISPIAPSLGFGISDRGLQASLDPRDPNHVAPGKRPRLTPNPGLVVGEDFVMPYGTPGGEVQTNAMLQMLVNHFDLGLDLQAAVEAPRWATTAVPATEDPHPCEPMGLKLEAPLMAEIGDDLRRRGHAISEWPRHAALAGGVCAVKRHGDGRLSAGADPRRMSYAVGW